MTPTVNLRSLEVPIQFSIHREHLGTLVIGIIKQILFHRDQMPMPYDIMDRHVKMGRSSTFNENLSAMHIQLGELFQSIADTFCSKSIYVDQVGILLGQNRFNAKEFHTISLPVILPSSRRALADLRPDDLNSILRFVLEEDPFCKFPAGTATLLHVFMRGSPVDLNDPFLEVFEPLLRFVPGVSSNCPQATFKLELASSQKARQPATVRRSGSHWSVCPNSRHSLDLSETEGIRKRLFDDSQIEDDVTSSTDSSVCSEAEISESESDGEGQGQETEEKKEMSENSDEENDDVVGSKRPSMDPAAFLWYRSKLVIAGWTPQQSLNS